MRRGTAPPLTHRWEGHHLPTPDTFDRSDRSYRNLRKACRGTVCYRILSRATHCHGSVENLKLFYLHSHIPQFFGFSFSLRSLRLYLSHVTNLDVM